MDYSDMTEAQLRDEYFRLEQQLSNLWNPHRDESFQRHRFDLDALYVSQLVQVKEALAKLWVRTGQITL